jgi:hypothetical protein
LALKLLYSANERFQDYIKNQGIEEQIMKMMAAILAGALLIMAAGSVSAYTINSDYAKPLPVNYGFSSPYAGVQVETFDSALLWNWGGSYTIRSGSTGGVAAAPTFFGTEDPSKYLVVPKEGLRNGTATAELNGTYNYFGLWWGSIDAVNVNGISNTINFYKNGSVNPVASISGSDVYAQANGSWTANDTNRYVNILGLPEFDSFTLTSVGRAFEVDNIAVGNTPVPEPSTFFLLGAGLGGFALLRRRMKK